jgi:hypothetical protein
MNEHGSICEAELGFSHEGAVEPLNMPTLVGIATKLLWWFTAFMLRCWRSGPTPLSKGLDRHLKPPCGGPQFVLQYLGRYTIACPSPTIDWSRLLMGRSRFVGATG